jgi:ATP-dependent RNA helicase RhlE
MRFSDFGLSDALLRTLDEHGYTRPTPIQQQAIPVALEGKDLMGAAQTGTGKTAGFTLPLLERLASKQRPRGRQARALIITPTRELAAQVHNSVRSHGKYLSLRSAVVFGGVKINPQISTLQRGVDVLVATPGRLLDLYQQKAIRFDDLEILVLDEADRMLDMGFIHDVRKILALLPKRRQTMLFSATFSNEIRKLAKGLLNNQTEIDVAPNTSVVETVRHKLHPVDKARKTALLTQLVINEGWYQALVFSRTKHGANKLAKMLNGAGIDAAAIHGNKSQNHRTRVLADFKKGKIQILVATDIAARGIDIQQLPQVVNFDLPNVPKDYVHRIGRTGRAGATGQAISLVCAEESKQLVAIERLIKAPIDRHIIEGFEPEVPLKTTPKRKQKPPSSGKRPSRPRHHRPKARKQNKRAGHYKENGNRKATSAS